MRRRIAFSLVELLVALAITAAVVPVALHGKNLSEDELAVQEAEGLARWLRDTFSRADAEVRFFEIWGVTAASPVVNVFWLDNMNGTITRRRDTYSSSGNALFVSQTSTNVTYSPVVNFTNPFGMTIKVYRKSGTASGVSRYVIVSRFGRVRVSKEYSEE